MRVFGSSSFHSFNLEFRSKAHRATLDQELTILETAHASRSFSFELVIFNYCLSTKDIPYYSGAKKRGAEKFQ